MPFQPFGYRFQIETHLRPEQVNQAIREKKRDWFDAKKGPRGWIVGSVICLWLSAFDRHGPMVIGRIINTGQGTRVSGRAGSDLNGVAWMVVIATLLVAIVATAYREGKADGGQFILVTIILIAMLPLYLWFGHKDRKQADPLVRFLREAIGTAPPKKPRRAVAFPENTIVPMVLELSGREKSAACSTKSIREALQALTDEEEEFVIVSIDETHFIQSSYDGMEYLLERREGSAREHYRACPPGGRALTLQEVEAAFAAWCGQKAQPAGIDWRPLFKG